MDRGISYGSKICARRVEQRRHEMHRERIKNMKSLVDTSEPLAQAMDHVRNNLKREQILEERYSEIDKANRILLKKMSDIMRAPVQPVPPPGPKPGPVSLNHNTRKKELLRITRENQHILRRIQQAQPVYNHVEWEGTYKKNTTYLKNVAEYPLVLRQPRRANMSSQLVPLGDEMPDGPFTERIDRDQGAAGLELDDVTKYVFKEGRKLGSTYYLIEMSTDGRILHVSAYDGDAQCSLDLVIKERDHRNLYREANGDYSFIADRLAVSGAPARLVLMDESQVGLPASRPAPLAPLASSSSSGYDTGGYRPAPLDTGNRPAPLVPVAPASPPESPPFIRGFKPPSPGNGKPPLASVAQVSTPRQASPPHQAQTPRAALPPAPAPAPVPALVPALAPAPAPALAPAPAPAKGELDADAMIVYKADSLSDTTCETQRMSSSEGFVSAEVELNSTGEFQFRLRGLTPDSDDNGVSPAMSFDATATSSFGFGR